MAGKEIKRIFPFSTFLKKAFSLERLPLTAAIVHSILIIVVVGLALIPWSNPDSSIAFVMVCITGYVIDFPIGMLTESIRPIVGESSAWPIVVTAMFIFLGGAYWYLIGAAVATIGKIIKRKIHGKVKRSGAI